MNQASATGLCRFIEASPSPFHAVAEVVRLLDAAGFVEVDEGGPPAPLEPGEGAYIVRDASVVAWRNGMDAPAAAGFRLVGAHTDSPNLRLKARPDRVSEGYRQWGVEVYGGVILATWADRDLGVSGRVAVRTAEGGVASRLLRCDRPVARIPNLAIHLNREVNSKGLILDQQKHLPPVLGMGAGRDARAWIAGELGCEPGELLAWELGLHDVTPPTVGGIDDDFVFAPRLDNLASCYAGLMGLLAAQPTASTAVLALFDHEEVGSQSYRGAAGPLLRDVLERVVRDHTEQASGGLMRAVARSWMASADMAHGVHPNYADLHEPNHKPVLNGGPVLKGHVEQRYATDAETTARFRAVAADLGIPLQDFVSRTDLACGTTIGPITAAELGLRTVDVGGPMLSMHSIREQCGAEDVPTFSALLQGVFEEGRG